MDVMFPPIILTLLYREHLIVKEKKLNFYNHTYICFNAMFIAESKSAGFVCILEGVINFISV